MVPRLTVLQGPLIPKSTWSDQLFCQSQISISFIDFEKSFKTLEILDVSAIQDIEQLWLTLNP